MKIQDYNRETLSSITRKILEADIEHCYKKKNHLNSFETKKR